MAEDKRPAVERRGLSAANAGPMACVVMAAGRGTRMGARGLPKVCFPVVGVPLINRSIAAYRACGIGTIVVVIGQDGQQVMDTVSAEFDGVLFARQREPRGTGDAARAGFEPLRRLRFEGIVFCAVGDKVVRPEAVRQVLHVFLRTRADAVIAVTEKPEARDMGHVLLNARGEAEAVVEEGDLRAADLLREIARSCSRGRTPLDVRPLRDECVRTLGSEPVCERLLGRVWRQIASRDRVTPAQLRSVLPPRPGQLRIGGRWLDASEVRRDAPYRHESLYVFKSSVLARGLPLLRARRRREVYLTDIVQALAHPPKGQPAARIQPVVLRDREWMLGCNSPEQLLLLEEKTRVHVRGAQRIGRPAVRLSRRLLRPAGEWAELLEKFPARVRRRFSEIYGPDRAVLEVRRRDMLRPVKRFCRLYGPSRAAIIARAPATVNLMGRHVDVVGGFINVTNVDREAVVVASPRGDDLVRLAPSGARAGSRAEFAIGHEIAGLGWDDWLTYISSDRVREMVSRARGDWSHIVRAAAVRLQQHFKTRRLRGMDAVVQSNIPLASGLGASAAMLVAASEAFVALNALEITPHQFVLLCGEGEWYLGSRGTAAPHAGMKLGRRGQIAHLRFFPFEVDRLVPFPEGYRIVLCHAPPLGGGPGGREDCGLQIAECGMASPKSAIRNPQSDGLAVRARALAAMEIGLLVLRDRHPHLARLMEHVRDLNPRRLGVSLRELYGMLLGVPCRCVPSRLRRILSAEGRDHLDRSLAGIGSPSGLAVRDALCFGMAECARSELMALILERCDLARAAALLRASHDAERAGPYRWTASDAHLRRCIEDLSSEDPARVLRAQLALQPGRFGPGVPEIDQVIDVAQSVEGVLGAQLSGGECAMVIAREEAVQPLARALGTKSFASRVTRHGVDPCSFVEGAGVLAL